MLNWFSVELPLKMFKYVMIEAIDPETVYPSVHHSENMLKMLFHFDRHFRKSNFSTKLFINGCYTPVGKPAGIDVIEVGEITVHVQGEPMHGDKPACTNPYSTNLSCLRRMGR